MSSLTPLRDDLKRVGELLSPHLPWSPHDYVPGISREGDRAIWADELTRPLPAEDDLRFYSPRGAEEGIAIFAQRLPWDTKFFGYGVARLDGVFPLSPPFHRPQADFREPLGELLEAARSRDIRYLFAHVDPRDQALLQALGAHGFTLIETRLHYHLSVQIVHYLRLPDHLPQEWAAFRTATADDIASLTEVACAAVNPYDRFHGDPFISREQVDQLMARWVEESVLGRFADLTFVPDVPQPQAFITYRLHKESWPRWGLNLVQVVLSAVAPEAIGWFASVGPELHRHLRGLGAQHCFGKTQIALGLDSAAQFGKGEHIFRVIL